MNEISDRVKFPHKNPPLLLPLVPRNVRCDCKQGFFRCNSSDWKRQSLMTDAKSIGLGKKLSSSEGFVIDLGPVKRQKFLAAERDDWIDRKVIERLIASHPLGLVRQG